MDKEMKGIYTAITIVIILIVLKFTVFDTLGATDELIPGVTDDSIFTRIPSNHSRYEYITSDSFSDEISGINIGSRSEIYGTNETNGKTLFKRCCDRLIVHCMDEEKTEENTDAGIYTGVYHNDTAKIVFHIFEGEKLEEKTGFYVLLTVYRMSL